MQQDDGGAVAASEVVEFGSFDVREPRVDGVARVLCLRCRPKRWRQESSKKKGCYFQFEARPHLIPPHASFRSMFGVFLQSDHRRNHRPLKTFPDYTV